MAFVGNAFNAGKFTASAAHRAIYRRYEIAYTSIDLLAGFTFLIGSILFFWKATETAAIWLFVVGSLFFFLRPLARIARELELARLPVPEDDDARRPGAEDVDGSDHDGRQASDRDRARRAYG
ncbi:YrhK family protein [Amorphus sp. 3PC139-8]|uniref:YrhK family protein n=1 Tax=Amorphus sp. 3PC139-8 TaxID=2735676 RepID=UPI00345CA27C